MEEFIYLPLSDRVAQLEQAVGKLQQAVGTMQKALNQNNIEVRGPAPPPQTYAAPPAQPPLPPPPAYVPPLVNQPLPPQTDYRPAPAPASLAADAIPPWLQADAPPSQWLGAPQPASVPPLGQAAPPPIQQPKSVRPTFDLVHSTEYWLNKIGIGLFLLGIMFFFKYSIDRGWVTPALRVITGMLTGFGFLGLGLRLQVSRRAFSQVLLGGGLATLYISVFAAFQLYNLVAYPVAFGAMVSITLLGFGLALRQNDMILSLIAAAGGLATPFILYTGSGNIPGLMGYTCLVLAGTCAIYFFKGWRSLLWFSFASGVVILLMAASTLPYDVQLMQADRWALQAGGIVIWLLFWLVPVAALVRKGQQFAQFDEPEGFWKRELSRVTDLAHQLSISTGLGILAFSGLIWRLSETQLGGLAFAGVASYALIGVIVWSTRRARDLAYTQGLMATLLLTMGWALTLHGDVLFWTLAAEAAVLHLLAWRLKDPLFTFGGHALAAWVGLWFLVRLEPISGQMMMLNARALTDLVALGLLYGVSYLFAQAQAARTYRFIIHAALFGWLWRELADQPLSYTMLAWAIYSVGLHLFANRPSRRELIVLAHFVAGWIALWFMSTLIVASLEPVTIMFTAPALTDLAVLAILYGASYLFGRETHAADRSLIYADRIYRLVIHAAVLGWLWRELGGLPISYTMLAWAMYSLGLHAFANVPARREWSVLAHLATGGIALWFLPTLTWVASQTPIFNLYGAMHLLTIGLVGGVALIIRPRLDAPIYGLGAYIALLAWLWHEFAALPSGNAFTSIGWGICAVILFGIGLRRDHQLALRTAVGTVGLIVVKLFLIDLANVDAIWRILLFLGFGSVFLALSYSFRNLWRPAVQAVE